VVNYLLSENSSVSKKRKACGSKVVKAGAMNMNRIKTGSAHNLKILKRLNVIIEQESDLAFYGYDHENTITSNTGRTSEQERIKEILQSYDLIAFSPRNETVLSTICNSQKLFYSDIIMLDYTSGRGGVQLPFKLKKGYVAQLRNAVWRLNCPMDRR
jgi:hypothetical protein